MGCPDASCPAISCVAPDGVASPGSTASPRMIVVSVKCSSADVRRTAGAASFAVLAVFAERAAGFAFRVLLVSWLASAGAPLLVCYTARRLSPTKSLAFRIVWRATNEALRFRGRAHINGRLERPDRRQAFSRWVDVRGWAIAQSGDPLALRVTLNGRHVKTIAATEQRADVTAAAHGLAQAPGPVWGFDDVVMLDERRRPPTPC